METLQEKIDKSISLLKKGEYLAKAMSPDGYYVAFSGGKDSLCVYYLCKLAQVKHKAHCVFTSMEPPQLTSFVKTFNDVEIVRPSKSIFDIIKNVRRFPSRKERWCCQLLKEKHGRGCVTLTGVRKEESKKRSTYDEFHFGSVTKKSMPFDEFDIVQQALDQCFNRQTKFYLQPILDWTSDDVWAFLDLVNAPHCKLYDEGYSRVGCLFCPMESIRSLQLDIINYPHIFKKWIETAKWLFHNGRYYNFKDVEELLKFWNPHFRNFDTWKDFL